MTINSVAAKQAIAAGNATWLPPTATYGQQSIGQSYQPAITWQDTTSNATYSQASSVLNVT